MGMRQFYEGEILHQAQKDLVLCEAVNEVQAGFLPTMQRVW